MSAVSHLMADAVKIVDLKLSNGKEELEIAYAIQLSFKG